MLLLEELCVLLSVIVFYLFIDIGIKYMVGEKVNRKFSVTIIIVTYILVHFVEGFRQFDISRSTYYIVKLNSVSLYEYIFILYAGILGIVYSRIYKKDIFMSSLYIVIYMIYYEVVINNIIYRIIYFMVSGYLISSEHRSSQTVFLFVNIWGKVVLFTIFGILIISLKNKGRINLGIRLYSLISITTNILLIIVSYGVRYLLIRGNMFVGIDFRSEVYLFNISIMPKLLTISAIINILIYRISVKEKIKEYEYKSLQGRLAMQEDYFTNTRQVQDRIRNIYHDLNNYIIAIENQGIESDLSTKMIEGIKSDLSEYRNIYNTGNKLVDIILFEKYKTCKEYGIILDALVDMSRGDFIEPIDISSIFANILDNAIEANKVIQTGEKKIELRVGVVKSYLIIKSTNTKINKIVEKKNIILTSKKDKGLHGIGLKSIKMSVEKYGGNFSYFYDDSTFGAKVMIPLSNKIKEM